MNKINKHGFAAIEILIVVIVLAVIGFIGWRVVNGKSKDNNNQSQQNQTERKSDTSNSPITWSFDGKDKWSASSTPPQCNEPVKFSVAAIPSNKIESILYPGQVRGGDYKPHGGFRLNTPSPAIEVKAIMDGTVTSGSRYIEVGEVQYMFTIVNDCGIAYRFDHLLELSPVFQKLADKLPAAKVDDSRTTNLDGASVKTGDVIATAVGHKKPTANYGFDLGVYDYRKQNASAGDPTYIAKHKNELSQAAYAVCWFDMFPSADATVYKSLPAADQNQGKNSDYCK